jgi:hypothetical protein
LICCFVSAIWSASPLQHHPQVARRRFNELDEIKWHICWYFWGYWGIITVEVACIDCHILLMADQL